MGEFFLKRLFVFVLLFFSTVVFSVGVFSVVHTQYSGFSSAGNGFVFNSGSGLVSVVDTAVYKTGYYSVNGSAWQSFTLVGTSYNGNVNWLSGSSSYTLPFLGVGEHYIIVYSCAYNQSISSWDCHDSGWQLIVVNNSGFSCGGVVCSSGEYCSNGVCLLNVSGHTYFVATNGNDNNPGTFSQPWKTWGKAFDSANAGDVVYFRGGIYSMDIMDGSGYYLTRSGDIGKYIRYFNYPGEKPILDFNNIESVSTLNFGITSYVSNVHFKGLTVRNVLQKRPEVQVVAWDVSGHNSIVENCVVYNTGGIGFRAYGGNNLSFINCDSYNNSDILTTELPGNDGYGFFNNNLDDINTITYYKNCRAWNNGDDGWALNDVGYVELDNCWSFGNGQLQGAGNGFKLGFTYGPSPLLQRTVKKCIAAGNRASGITQNSGIDYDVVNFNVYNNLIYHNGYYPEWSYPVYGIWIYNTAGTDAEELRQVFRNNINYANEDGPIYVQSGAVYTHEYNSWDSSVVVDDSDFVSLDINQLSAERKADGSLPDITFGHLAEGSDLIDKGVNVGLSYLGNAPDLGPFEYVGAEIEICNGELCSMGEYCSNGVCLLNVSGNTYFVAVNGNDAWPGNFTHPWGTWQKAFSTADAGDIVYFRGGVYYIVNSDSIEVENSGTVSNPIRYFNYPGESPILDGIQNTISSDGIDFLNINNVHLKGLTIQNIFQMDHGDRFAAFAFSECDNITIENCVAHDIGCRGFWIYEPKNFYVYNTDAYNCIDPLSETPGNDGDGFIVWEQDRSTEDLSSRVIFRDCRAWNNADDGWDAETEGYIELHNCWAFNQGIEDYNIGGNGFKLGLTEVHSTTLARNVTECIAANNLGSGFTTNDNNCEGKPMNFYNNVAYNNDWGFTIYSTSSSDSQELLRVFRNNIAYNNTIDVLQAGGALYTHNHNTWDSSVTVNNADFVSLITSQLSAPRKADGSLPDITFGHLVQGSDLIDAGINVGLNYYGDAPDLGAFESNY